MAVQVGQRGAVGQNSLPCDVLVTSDSYLQEDGLYDCSIEDTISIYLPAMEIVDKMGAFMAWQRWTFL